MSRYKRIALINCIAGLLCSSLYAGNETNYWAMLTGINEYSSEYGVSSLSACVKDVNDMYDVLRADSTRWTVEKMTKYTDSGATKSAIQSAFASMANSMDQNDVLLYFQSSHGGQYGGYDTFLCMHDGDYTDDEMASDLEQFPSNVKIIIIIDACQSGGLFKSGDDIPAWNFASNVMRKLNTKLKEKGLEDKGASIAWMTACDYNETCSETSDNGIFTKYIVQGLEGSAETSGDGYITFKEAFDYADPLATQMNFTQHAQTYNDTTLSSTIAVKADNPSPGGGGTTTTTTTTTTSTTSSGSGTQIINLTTTTTYAPENFTRARENDFNGDRISDLAVYDSANSSWYISTPSGSILAWNTTCGLSACIPVSGDFNGDGKCDITLFGTEDRKWFSKTTSGSTIIWSISSGSMGDTPVSGDFNGDGRDDISAFDSTTGLWYVLETDGIILKWGMAWGWNGAIPVSGDYNGDAKSDYAVFDDQTARWFILSSEEELIAWSQQWGWTGAVPVSGDYNGDGRNDLALFDDNNGYWYVMSLTGEILVWGVQWGWNGAIPVSGDYNGDGKSDLTVYDSSRGYWYSLSTDGTVIMWARQWGWNGADISAR